jgi:porphobilinogen synthase
LLRPLVQEHTLSVNQLIAPVFVREGLKGKEPIPSLPGLFRFGLDGLAKEVEELAQLGIKGVLLFGIPVKKDPHGRSAWDPQGIVPKAVKVIKRTVPSLAVITDVCLCEYTSHGHCGVLKESKKAGSRNRKSKLSHPIEVDNDATLPLLAKIAVSYAQAGADVVAPSAMMDGQVGAIRAALDRSGFPHAAILAYSAKYASALYGPFREAAQSAPQAGDRRGYQMDPPNTEEALREVELDIQEGADWVMVKPALPYLDIVHRIKEQFRWPLAVYHVSGEYAMIKAAAARGWVEERRLVEETVLSIRRAGADLIITYFAKPLAQWLKKGGIP